MMILGYFSNYVLTLVHKIVILLIENDIFIFYALYNLKGGEIMKVTDLSLQNLQNLLIISKPEPRFKYDSNQGKFTDEQIGWRFKVSNAQMSDPLDVSFDGDLPKFVKPFVYLNLVNLRISYVKNGVVYARCDGFSKVQGE